jgi:hypothetical protein
VNLTNVYFPAVIKARGDDGSLLVSGKATDSNIDIDSQICDQDWLKQAMPDWFEWGNIREQHSSIAAGVATEYEVKDDGHYVTAKIVDTNSAKKVEEGVLKGFSIGIKSPRIVKDKAAPGGRIVGGEIVEISLVDRPANTGCKLVLAKSAHNDADDPVQFTQVEELIETPPGRAELAAAIGVTLGKLVKTPEDIDVIKRALGRLIAEEGAELAAGEDEAWSLESLMSALNAIKSYEWSEAAEGEPADGDANDGKLPEDTPDEVDAALRSQPTPGLPTLVLADLATLLKGASLDERTDLVRMLVPELTAQVGTIAEEQTKAAAALEELAALKAEVEAQSESLAKVLKMAAPGGPARMGRSGAAASTVPPELIKARHYRDLAAQLDGQETAKGYLTLAEQLESSLAERTAP